MSFPWSDKTCQSFVSKQALHELSDSLIDLINNIFTQYKKKS